MITKNTNENISIDKQNNGYFHAVLGEIIYPSYSNKSFLNRAKSNKLHYAIALYDEKDLHTLPLKKIEYSNIETSFYLKLGKLYHKNFKDLEIKDILSIPTSDILDMLIPLKEHYRLLKSNVLEQNYAIIKYRAQGYTLQEIGEIFEVTRERIRQRQNNALRMFNRFIEIVCLTLFNEDGYLALSDLEDVFEEEDTPIIQYLIEQNKHYKIIKKLDKIVLRSKLRTKEIRLFLEEFLQEDFLEEEYLVLIEEELKTKGITYLDSNDLKYLFLEDNFILIENTFIKLNSYVSPYLYVIKTRFKQGIELFQLRPSDDYKQLIRITTALFPSVKLVDSIRAIYARLTENLISIDRSIMIHPDNLSNNPEEIRFLVNYIEGSNTDTFSFTELYDKHKKRLNTLNISNRYFLRSLLQLGFNQNYEFTRDYIIKKGGEFLSSFDTIIKEVLDYKKPIYTKDLRTKFPYLSDIMLFSPLYNSPDIISWGHSRYIHRGNLPRIDGVEEVKYEIMEELRSNGVLSRSEFIKTISKYLVPFDYHLDNSLSVEPFINYYFKEDFHLKREMVHIYSEGKYNNYKDYLQFYFADVNKVSLDELNILARKKQLSYGNKQDILQLIAQNYLRINNNEFVILDHLTIDKEDIELVKSEIVNLLEFEKIASPINMVLKLPLPSVGFNWNEYSLISFIRLYLNDELIFIPTGNNHTLTKWGVITFTGKVQNISEFIYCYLKELDIIRISEHELCNHLRDLKVINGRIPHEVYESEIFEINNGIVKLL